MTAPGTAPRTAGNLIAAVAAATWQRALPVPGLGGGARPRSGRGRRRVRTAYAGGANGQYVAAASLAAGGAGAGGALWRGRGGSRRRPLRLSAAHGDGGQRDAEQRRAAGGGVGAARAGPAHDSARPVRTGAGQRRAHRLLRDPDCAVSAVEGGRRWAGGTAGTRVGSVL